MYSLAGTSIAQHKSDYQRLYGEGSEAFRASFTGNYSESIDPAASQEDKDNADAQMTNLFANVFENRLRRIHPVYSVRFDYVERAKAFYRSRASGPIEQAQWNEINQARERESFGLGEKCESSMVSLIRLWELQSISKTPNRQILP